MKTILFAFTLSVLSFLFVETVDAQVLDGEFKKEVYDKEHTPKKVPAPYQYVREADIMWSKTIWRKIDLREKMNQTLYYPDLAPNGTLMSLIDLLLYGIEHEGLNAYDPGETNEFKLPITSKAINERFGATKTTTMVENLETGVMEEKEVIIPAKTNEVKEYLVKELWYFDKQRSVMEVRIVGICPIRVFYKDTDIDQEDPKFQKLFWIYMPEWRALLARHEVYNPNNDAERLTFDDIFIKRYFSSYVVQESNTFNNRQITAYALGVDALLEAERIQNTIFEYEQDLWEY